MTEDEIKAEGARQAALLAQVLEPHMTQIAVTQAVLAALVADHPRPDLLRQRAESLLAQGQVALALLRTTPSIGERTLRLQPGPVQTALDYLFRPVKHLDPE